MMSTPIEAQQLKALFKEALVELLQERPELFAKILVDALEDLDLARAVREGEASPSVSREEVFKALQ